LPREIQFIAEWRVRNTPLPGSDLRTFLLKVFDHVGHTLKTVDSADSILCSFKPEQVTNGGVSLNEPQNNSLLGKFSIENAPESENQSKGKCQGRLHE
jgi:hypothetical protein